MSNQVPSVDKSEAPALSRPAYKNLHVPALPPVLPRLAYSMRETSVLLGLNYQTVYRLHKRGLLRSSGALRTKLFPLSEIQRFLAATAE